MQSSLSFSSRAPPLPQTFPKYRNRCSKIDLKIQALKQIQKMWPKVHLESPNWLNIVLLESFLIPTGCPEAPKTNKKHTGNQCVYDIHKIDLGCLWVALFAPPGPPNETPGSQKDGKGPQKASILDLCFAPFSLFFSLGCQMGPGRVPKRPPAPQND